MHTIIGNTRLELVEGDITEQTTDPIVTPARGDLLGGVGVDGEVHRKGGIQILDECIALGGCPVGEAVLTSGGNLPARHVIHTVGPVYEDGEASEADLLRLCYLNSLHIAAQQKFRSVAFPSISTGASGYPMREAAGIALRTVFDFLHNEPHDLELVRFVLDALEEPTPLQTYSDALEQLLAEVK